MTSPPQGGGEDRLVKRLARPSEVVKEENLSPFQFECCFKVVMVCYNPPAAIHYIGHTHTLCSQILPTAIEVIPGFLYFIEQTVANPLTYHPSSSLSLQDIFEKAVLD